MASIATACVLITCAEEAAAYHEVPLFLFTFGSPFVQSTLVPGYVSTVYYGVNTEKRMPLGWTVYNSISGAAGAGLGVVELGYTFSLPSDPEIENFRILLASAGAACVIGGTAVISATILQTMRPDSGTPQRGALVILPMISPPQSGASMGLMAAGRF